MIEVPEELIAEKFLAASGPGGQNVNKVATACQLRVDVFALGLHPETYRRLKLLAGSRLTAAGELVITARRFRTQEQNRADARARLAALLVGAEERAARRVKTKPSRAAKARRVDAKKGRGAVKAARGRVRESECPLPPAGTVAYLRWMHDFAIAAGSKHELYRDLLAALAALTADEPDPVANMANAAALAWQYLPDLNWAGFYRLIEDELVLGPFQGKPACIRIPVGKGVCGAAAATRETQRVDDVHAFPGHIACDANSRSELVVPLIVDGRLLGVLDLDSPLPARFDADDQGGCEALAALLALRMA